MKKRILAIILTIAMVLSMVPAAFAVEPVEPLIYVSIGDSNTNGYGLTGYELPNGTNVNGLLQETPGSYPVLFQQYLAETTGRTVDLIQLGVSGLRSADVMSMVKNKVSTEDGLHVPDATLYPDYHGNKTQGQYNEANAASLPFAWSYDKSSNVWRNNVGERQSMHDLYSKSLEIADVISINIGSNDFSTALWGHYLKMIVMYMQAGTPIDPVKANIYYWAGYNNPDSYQRSMRVAMDKMYTEEGMPYVDAELRKLAMNLNAEIKLMASDMLSQLITDESLDAAIWNEMKDKEILINNEGVTVDYSMETGEYNTVQEYMTAVCNEFADRATFSFLSYINSNLELLKWINENNSDAKVMVVNMVNFMKELKTLGENGKQEDFDTIMSYVIDMANFVLADEISKLQADEEYKNELYYADTGVNVPVFAQEMSEWSAKGYEGADVLLSRVIQSMSWHASESFLPDEDDAIIGGGLPFFVGNDWGDRTTTVDSFRDMADAIAKNDPTLLDDATVANGFDVAFVLGLERAMVKGLDKGGVSFQFLLSLLTAEYNTKFDEFRNDLKDTLVEKGYAQNEAYSGGGYILQGKAISAEQAFDVAKIVEEKVTNSPVASSWLYLQLFFDVGDGVACHPSLTGHEQIVNAMKAAYPVNEDDESISAGDHVNKEIPEKIKLFYDFLKADGIFDTEAKLDLLYKLYMILEGQVDLSAYEKEINTVVEIYEYLVEKQFINDEDTLGIILCVYEKLMDGEVTYADLRAIADYIYFDVFAVEGYVRTASTKVDITASIKLDILETVYGTLKDNGIVADIPEIAAFENLYNEIKSEGLLTEEQTLDIFNIVFENFVESDEFDTAGTTSEVVEYILTNPEIPNENRAALAAKAADVIGDLGEYLPSLSEMVDYFLENYEEIYAMAWNIANENGYVAVAEQYLTEIENIIAGLDFTGIGLSDELIAELDALKAEVAEDVAALNAVVAAPEHDQAADKFWALADELKESLTALEAAAKQAGSDAYDQFKIVYAEAKQQLETAFKQAVAALKEEIKNKIDEVVHIDLSAIKGVIADLETAIADIKAQIAEIKKYTAAGLDGVVDELTAELAEAEAYLAKLNALVESVEDLVNEIENEPELTIEKVTAIVALAEEIVGDTMNLVDEIETALTTLAEVYETVVPQLLAAAEGPAKDALDATDAEMEAVVAAIEAAYEDTLAAITDAAANIETIVCDTAEAVYGSAATAVQAIIEATEIAAGDIYDAVVPALETIKTEAGKLADSTDDEIREAGEKLLDLIIDIEQTLPVDEIKAELIGVEAIVDDIADILMSVEDAATAEAALDRIVEALEDLGEIAVKIYDIADDDVIALVANAAVYAEEVKAIVEPAAGNIGTAAAEAYKTSAEAVGTAAELTIEAVGTAVDAYEQAVTTAAGEIITAITDAAAPVADEVNFAVAATTKAVNAALAQIDNSYETVITAWQYAVYDATHGEYTIDCGSYYVSLGDSTVTGMNTGDPAYGNYGYKTVVPNSFSYKLAEKLGLDVETQYIQLALAGLRTSDLRYILDETFTPDEYTLTRTKSRVDNHAGGFEAMRETYKAELAKADLVTLSMGNCNLTDYISAQISGTVAELIKNQEGKLAEVLNSDFGKENILPILAEYVNLDASTYEMDWDAYLTTPEAKAQLAAALAEVKATLLENGIPETISIKIEELVPEYAAILDDDLALVIPVADLATQIVEFYAYACVTHVMNYAEVIKLIHEYSDAHVVAMGISNPIEELVVTFQNIKLPLGDYLDYAFQAINLTGLTAALITDDTTYVAIEGIESNTEVALGNVAEIDVVDYVLGIFDGTFDFHATAEAHTVMAETVYNALTVTPGEHEFVLIDEKAADCDEDGYKTYECSICGYKYTDIIPATGHVYGDDDICDVCGHDKTPSTPTPGPVFGGGGSAKWSCNGGASCPSCQYEDLAEAIKANKNIWWHEATDYVIKNKLMNGMTDTLFMPNYTTTRAMLVTILWREAGSPIVNADMAFADVAEGQWYTEAIRWAASKGIVDGISDTEFAPDAKITREQMVTIFYRYAKNNGVNVNKGNASTIEKFSDTDKISSWAYDAMKWACGNKFVEGKENNNIDPTGNATRVEMATLIMRFIEDVM